MLVLGTMERERSDIIARFKKAIKSSAEVVNGFDIPGGADFVLYVTDGAVVMFMMPFCTKRTAEVTDSGEKRNCSFVTYCICRSTDRGTKIFVVGVRP